ncbi:hypothetical protein BC826DRAFT_1112068 [Russula brevipes]|nr:hypothetical protein BC826DRAFT_1112068 [Russula brevipes]
MFPRPSDTGRPSNFGTSSGSAAIVARAYASCGSAAAAAPSASAPSSPAVQPIPPREGSEKKSIGNARRAPHCVCASAPLSRAPPCAASFRWPLRLHVLIPIPILVPIPVPILVPIPSQSSSPSPSQSSLIPIPIVYRLLLRQQRRASPLLLGFQARHGCAVFLSNNSWQPLTLNVSDTSTLVPPRVPPLPSRWSDRRSIQTPVRIISLKSSLSKRRVPRLPMVLFQSQNPICKSVQPPSHQESSPALEPLPPAFTPLQERMLQVPLTLCVRYHSPQAPHQQPPASNCPRPSFR